MLLFIKLLNASALPLEVKSGDITVLELKELIYILTDISSNKQRLIYGGKILKDEITLNRSSIEKEVTLQLFEIKDINENNSAKEKTNISSNSQSLSNYDILSSPIASKPVIETLSFSSIVLKEINYGNIVIVDIRKALNILQTFNVSEYYFLLAYGNQNYKSKIHRTENVSELFGFHSYSSSTSISMLLFESRSFGMDKFLAYFDFIVERGNLTSISIPSFNSTNSGFRFEANVGSFSVASSFHFKSIKSLVNLEHSWTSMDLIGTALNFEQLIGNESCNGIESDITKGFDHSNPVIENLLSILLHNSELLNKDGRIVVLNLELQEKINIILRSQGYISRIGSEITNCIWISTSFEDLITNSLKNFKFKFKKVLSPDLYFGQCAVIEFENSIDAIIGLINITDLSSDWKVGFGAKISSADSLWSNCMYAGWVNVCVKMQFELFWIFVYPSHILLLYSPKFLNFREEFEYRSKNCYFVEILRDSSFSVILRGCLSLEIRYHGFNLSVFIKSTSFAEHLTLSKSLSNPDDYSLFHFNNEDSYLDSILNPNYELLKQTVVKTYKCSTCSNSFSINNFYFSKGFISEEFLQCTSCCKYEISFLIANNDDITELNLKYSPYDIHYLMHESIEILSQFYDKMSLNYLKKSIGTVFLKCPKCNTAIEFNEFGNDGGEFHKVECLEISKNLVNPVLAQSHFLQYRIRCRNSDCFASFCRLCNISPYHTGLNCKDYETFINMDRCRFCDQPILDSNRIYKALPKAFYKVCNSDECVAKLNISCSKELDCNHYCGGLKIENECLPCMQGCSEIDVDDICSICCCETLKSSPCVKLGCNHIFHYVCIRKKILQRWPGPAISFNFMGCPLCNEKIAHVSLDCMMKPFLKFELDITEAAIKRLEFENLLNDVALTDPQSIFFNSPEKYALDIYAFYQCYKCKKPYFGGRHECAVNEQFQACELICGNCVGLNVSSCTIHGKDYIQFKCKFCCNIGTFYCWGSTHFCASCHKRQVKHDYVTTIPRSQLPQCLGPELCPLRISHPPNGEEFSLGCVLCKSLK